MKNGKAVAASVFHLWIRITPLEFCLLALLFIFFFFLLQLLLLWNTNFFFIILELGTLLNGFMGYFMTSMMEKVFPKKKKWIGENGKLWKWISKATLKTILIRYQKKYFFSSKDDDDIYLICHINVALIDVLLKNIGEKRTKKTFDLHIGALHK